MLDPDTVNENNAESYQYRQWEREKKNTILSWSDTHKKQAEWNRLFAQPTYSKEITEMVW